MRKQKRPSWAQNELGELVADAGLDVNAIAEALGQSYTSTWRMLSGRYTPSTQAICALWEIMHSHGVDGGKLLDAIASRGHE